MQLTISYKKFQNSSFDGCFVIYLLCVFSDIFSIYGISCNDLG
jgi:hypothetical protein